MWLPQKFYEKWVGVFGFVSAYGVESAASSGKLVAYSVKAQKPVIAVDQATHDFGTVWEGSKLKHEFKITNKGNAALKIIKVKSGCVCAAVGTNPKRLLAEDGQGMRLGIL